MILQYWDDKTIKWPAQIKYDLNPRNLTRNAEF